MGVRINEDLSSRMPVRLVSRGAIVVILFFFALISLAASWEAAAFFFILGIAVWYFSTPKCPQCGRRGNYMLAGTKVLGEEHTFGIVTRKTMTTRNRRGRNGRTRYEDVTTREERAPVIRTTTRYTYACKKCGRTTFTDKVTQQEDFSRGEESSPQQTVVVQKEIVKVPCKYCGVLNEITARTCSNCGAAIKP